MTPTTMFVRPHYADPLSQLKSVVYPSVEMSKIPWSAIFKSIKTHKKSTT